MEEEKKEELQTQCGICEDNDPQYGTEKGGQYGGYLFVRVHHWKQLKATGRVFKWAIGSTCQADG
jgi:hypothetical protein